MKIKKISNIIEQVFSQGTSILITTFLVFYELNILKVIVVKTSLKNIQDKTVAV